MRGRFASIAAATTVLVLIFLLFLSAPTTWRTTISEFRGSPPPIPGHGPYTGWPDPLPWNPPSPKEASNETPAECMIIKVKLEDEYSPWIKKLEPPWRTEVITIKSMYSHAHPEAHRPDKGRVANAYLRWIVENYHHLPETMIFLTPMDSYELHTLDPRDAIPRLQIPFIQSSGFANLHCPSQKSRTTCNNKFLEPTKPSYELRTLEAKIPEIWEKWFSNTMDVPDRIATVLRAEFAVSRAQMQKRSVEDYLKFWTWLNRTIMDDDSSGLVFEYLWHIIFGKDAIFCPEREQCQCELYGKCEV